MHCGNFAMLASFLRMGTMTSSTRAQKCSRELGWMSPQVMWFSSCRIFLLDGSGSVSRFTKNTPLFLSTETHLANWSILRLESLKLWTYCSEKIGFFYLDKIFRNTFCKSIRIILQYLHKLKATWGGWASRCVSAAGRQYSARLSKLAADLKIDI